MKTGNVLLPKDFKSSFLSCEKDLETIIKKLFVLSRPYSDDLKKLLVVNTKDCFVTDNPTYNAKVQEMTVSKLIEDEYLRFAPKMYFTEGSEVKSYIIIEFSPFVPNNTNPTFRNVTLGINVICHSDYWLLNDYQLRPIKIMGYIDGILDKTKLSGIGQLNFMGAQEISLNDVLSGYLMTYQAIHGSDDSIEESD